MAEILKIKHKVNLWQNFPVPKLEVRAEIRVVFNLQYLSQIFIKFNNRGVFQNPQDMQIPKLSLKFKIVLDFMEKKTKILATGKRAKTVFNLSPCPLKTATNSV